MLPITNCLLAGPLTLYSRSFYSLFKLCLLPGTNTSQSFLRPSSYNYLSSHTQKKKKKKTLLILNLVESYTRPSWPESTLTFSTELWSHTPTQVEKSSGFHLSLLRPQTQSRSHYKVSCPPFLQLSFGFLVPLTSHMTNFPLFLHSFLSLTNPSFSLINSLTAIFIQISYHIPHILTSSWHYYWVNRLPYDLKFQIFCLFKTNHSWSH